MSGSKVINLRLARKRKQRTLKEAQAEANRAKSSIAGTIRRAAKAEAQRQDTVLSGHWLDPAGRKPT